MAHANIVNHTGFQLQSIFSFDEHAAPCLTQVVKATLQIPECQIVEKERQLPVQLAGIFNGKPDCSSYRYEPEVAGIKLTTDVVLIGHAHATHRNQTQIDVVFQVGNLQKRARVFGDRQWVRRMGMLVTMTDPLPIEAPIPLIYERAFGGWDSTPPNPFTGRFEPRNPVGVGYKRAEYQDGLPLPNLEDPNHLLKNYGDTPPPAGFGFISPSWLPRARYAGTYGDKWQKERAPLLPDDFDPRFHNSASPGLISDKYLQGDEPVTIENATSGGRLQFQLPGIRPPVIHVQLRGGIRSRLETNLDTVIVNSDDMLLIMLWRQSMVLRNGPHDVSDIEVTCDNFSEKSTVA